ncbi:PIG-L family deacetylase [Lentzea sp. NPDC005914]|uniref:PIG-L family deacetylase n=1 Tax=Lentzea sp. NPDC005914 TaxID=3154572 RepID=UPI0033F604EE
MSRTRAAVAGAAVLATAFTSAPTQAAAEGACQGRVLNIVAHHDDDLLFLSPDLITDIRRGKCVRTVFLVASDYPNNRQISNDDYMRKRELGVREAYARAAGVDSTKWSSAPHDTGKATQWTLGERISLVELRISDTSTEPQNRLWRLYALNQPVKTREGDRNAAQTFTRDRLGGFLRDVVQEFRPDEIKAGDPLADHRSNSIHLDHLATARLVRWALDGRGTPVKAYRDYSISSEPENLSDSEVATKTDVFTAFVQHDQDICPTSPDCAPARWTGPAYREWMRRQYLVDQR